MSYYPDDDMLKIVNYDNVYLTEICDVETKYYDQPHAHSQAQHFAQSHVQPHAHSQAQSQNNIIMFLLVIMFVLFSVMLIRLNEIKISMNKSLKMSIKALSTLTTH